MIYLFRAGCFHEPNDTKCRLVFLVATGACPSRRGDVYFEHNFTTQNLFTFIFSMILKQILTSVQFIMIGFAAPEGIHSNIRATRRRCLVTRAEPGTECAMMPCDRCSATLKEMLSNSQNDTRPRYSYRAVDTAASILPQQGRHPSSNKIDRSIVDDRSESVACSQRGGEFWMPNVSSYPAIVYIKHS